MIIQQPLIIRNFDAWHDGISYAGRCTTAKCPAVKVMKKDHRGATMDGSRAVDVGLEAMTAELTFADWPDRIVTLLGTEDRITLRPVARGKGNTAVGYIVTLGGLFSEVAPEGLEAGKESPLKVGLEVNYYRLERDGTELFEIDVDNVKRIVGGVDQLAETRRKMGH